jgi:hypothetical protein
VLWSSVAWSAPSHTVVSDLRQLKPSCVLVDVNDGHRPKDGCAHWPAHHRPAQSFVRFDHSAPGRLHPSPDAHRLRDAASDVPAQFQRGP